MTTPKHEGLPVPGYKAQSDAAISAVTRLKHLEEHVLRELDALAKDPDIQIDPRWLATGRTDIEKGFMAANRSVFRPGRVALPEDGAQS